MPDNIALWARRTRTSKKRMVAARKDVSKDQAEDMFLRARRCLSGNAYPHPSHRSHGSQVRSSSMLPGQFFSAEDDSVTDESEPVRPSFPVFDAGETVEKQRGDPKNYKITFPFAIGWD